MEDRRDSGKGRNGIKRNFIEVFVDCLKEMVFYQVISAVILVVDLEIDIAAAIVSM